MQNLLVQGLRDFCPSPWLEVAISLTAAACGAIVGAERERHEKPAGLRTLVLVCLGSASFTMASYAFTTSSGDAGRVAAQIVTGIGFLGAGAILHGSGFISGMTTAATIWVTAAIGMIAGSGQAVAALALSVLVRFLFIAVNWWETRHIRSLPISTIHFLIDPARGKTRIRVAKIMEDYHAREVTYERDLTADGLAQGTATFILPQHHRREFLYALASIPEVLEITQEEPASRPARSEA